MHEKSVIEQRGFVSAYLLFLQGVNTRQAHSRNMHLQYFFAIINVKIITKEYIDIDIDVYIH